MDFDAINTQRASCLLDVDTTYELLQTACLLAHINPLCWKADAAIPQPSLETCSSTIHLKMSSSASFQVSVGVGNCDYLLSSCSRVLAGCWMDVLVRPRLQGKASIRMYLRHLPATPLRNLQHTSGVMTSAGKRFIQAQVSSSMSLLEIGSQ